MTKSCLKGSFLVRLATVPVREAGHRSARPAHGMTGHSAYIGHNLLEVNAGGDVVLLSKKE